MKHTPNFERTARHLIAFINPKLAKRTVAGCVKQLKDLEFDAIAFRGLSGALIAPTVAMRMGKTLIAVRKGEKSHSSNMVEGDRAARRYVIIDDFIASGATVEAILDGVHKWAPKAECIGVFQAVRITKPLKHPEWHDYPDTLCTDIVKQWRNGKSKQIVKAETDQFKYWDEIVAGRSKKVVSLDFESTVGKLWTGYPSVVGDFREVEMRVVKSYLVDTLVQNLKALRDKAVQRAEIND